VIKKRILACLVALCLAISLSGLPALADTADETTQAVTQAEQPVSSQMQADSQNSEPTYCIQPTGDPEPAGEIDRYYDSSEYIQAPRTGQRSTPIQQSSDPIQVTVDQDVNVIVDSQAKATTGQGDSRGTQITNSVGGTSQAIAVGGSGEPVDPSDSGAYAQNGVTKLVGNVGTADAYTGQAKADNTMDGNTARISSDVTVSVGRYGEIDNNSSITVRASLYYLAVVAGLATAKTGDSAALGLDADNSLDSTDKAFAKGDAGSSLAGGIYDGSALATNGSDNSIANTGTALAATGLANAGNDMQGNDIEMAPVVKAIINVCGDIINSNVTVNLIYKFIAMITGVASATSGDSAAIGADVDNNIDNSTNAKAIGDAPAATASGSGSYSDGSAVAGNDTGNQIANDGRAVGVSGDAAALNLMKNNDIFISPIITSEIDLLDNMVGSNVTINIIYNFWAQILGKANSTTGDADAFGTMADNSIANTSSATAIGDSAKPSLMNHGEQADGEAIALNDAGNSIKNNGLATSASGNSNSLNTMMGNKINLSPTLTTVAMVVKPLLDGTIVIDIVYDIWASLMGSSDTSAGNAVSVGTVSVNTIGSKSDAVAIADVTAGKPDGSATALNSSDNQIENDGDAKAFSGYAYATSAMTEALISVTGCLEQDILADGTKPAIERNNAIKAQANEEAKAQTGDTTATGDKAPLNRVNSTAISKNIFGNDQVAVNDHDADIFNKGDATAISGYAVAKTGSTEPNRTDNVILIGFNPANECPTSDCGQVSSAAQSTDNQDATVQANPDAKNGSPGGDVTAPSANGDSGGAKLGGNQDNIAYAAYTASDYHPIGLPLWLWVILFSILTGWIKLTLIVKPWKVLKR